VKVQARSPSSCGGRFRHCRKAEIRQSRHLRSKRSWGEARQPPSFCWRRSSSSGSPPGANELLDQQLGFAITLAARHQGRGTQRFAQLRQLPRPGLQQPRIPFDGLRIPAEQPHEQVIQLAEAQGQIIPSPSPDLSSSSTGVRGCSASHSAAGATTRPRGCRKPSHSWWALISGSVLGGRRGMFSGSGTGLASWGS
jgi:hypothetical protein